MPEPRTGSGDNAGRDWRESLREASPYVGLGMQLALTMVSFTGIGYLLDRWLETTPWLLVVGSVLGMVAVFAQLFRVSGELSRKDRSRSGFDKEPGGPSDA